MMISPAPTDIERGGASGGNMWMSCYYCCSIIAPSSSRRRFCTILLQQQLVATKREWHCRRLLQLLLQRQCIEFCSSFGRSGGGTKCNYWRLDQQIMKSELWSCLQMLLLLLLQPISFKWDFADDNNGGGLQGESLYLQELINPNIIPHQQLHFLILIPMISLATIRTHKTILQGAIRSIQKISHQNIRLSQAAAKLAGSWWSLEPGQLVHRKKFT